MTSEAFVVEGNPFGVGILISPQQFASVFPTFSQTSTTNLAKVLANLIEDVITWPLNSALIGRRDSRLSLAERCSKDEQGYRVTRIIHKAHIF